MRLLLAAIVALAALSAARANDVPSIKLIWFVVSTNEQGPVRAAINERQRFKTSSDCQDFGTEYTPRMQDWVRGVLAAEWDHPVQIAFKCDAGQPM
jgi:hypothetical protein